ncbi:CASP-like protein 4A1 isoform X3 [Strigops habroptila]|uniref:CASP-like protein 4A1 isoform X3 n=1 Tax=Strigops habroptila TaxID=2489341 RepID=UPI0011CF23F0|nr:CASP-like protein 4A1 isoform X3 [Strigops habroptila]
MALLPVSSGAKLTPGSSETWRALGRGRGSELCWRDQQSPAPGIPETDTAPPPAPVPPLGPCPALPGSIPPEPPPWGTRCAALPASRARRTADPAALRPADRPVGDAERKQARKEGRDLPALGAAEESGSPLPSLGM